MLTLLGEKPPLPWWERVGGEGDQNGKSLDSEIFITPTLPSPVEGEGENWD